MKSALNACRHHLTGQVTTMAEPDRVMYNLFLTNFMEDYYPKGAMEVQLVTRIAHDSWRLNRACAIEDNLFSLHAGGQYAQEVFGNHPEIDDSFATARAYNLQPVQKTLDRLTLYMQRTQRMVEKNTKMLQEIQKERREHEAKQMQEAKRLQQFHETKGLPYDPKADGFVFSSEEIAAEIERDDRLKQAETVKMTRAMRRKLRRMASGHAALAA